MFVKKHSANSNNCSHGSVFSLHFTLETYIELWFNLYLSWYKLTSPHYNCDKVDIFCQSEHSFKNMWGRFHRLEATKKLNEGFLVYWIYSLLHQIIDIFTIYVGNVRQNCSLLETVFLFEELNIGKQ